MSSAYYWVDYAPHKPIPKDAIKGGRDSDGSDMYIGRVRYENDLLPAKIISKRGQAYIPYGGKEIEVFQYQILCGSNLDWVLHKVGNTLPHNAIEGGKTKAGETLFIGRVIHKGVQTVGKVQQSHKACYIPYGGKELKFDKCELLTKRA